jgi:hypothetical protein
MSKRNPIISVSFIPVYDYEGLSDSDEIEFFRADGISRRYCNFGSDTYELLWTLVRGYPWFDSFGTYRYDVTGWHGSIPMGDEDEQT